MADLDLEVGDGELFVLVGPSGCGKTTVLRMIAGLENVSSGEVVMDGVVINDLEPGERDVAMAFQAYALYPHLTVAGNIGFPLRTAHVRGATVDRRVREVADLLQLADVLDRWPSQLSGGQQQRSALGRALIREPRLLLMDEPLSSLDTKLRAETRSVIWRLQRRLGADDRVRHPRPGGGDVDGRPHRRDAPGPHRAVRSAARAVRHAGGPVRRPVHRFAVDERHRGDTWSAPGRPWPCGSDARPCRSTTKRWRACRCCPTARPERRLGRAARGVQARRCRFPRGERLVQ